MGQHVYQPWRADRPRLGQARAGPTHRRHAARLNPSLAASADPRRIRHSRRGDARWRERLEEDLPYAGTSRRRKPRRPPVVMAAATRTRTTSGSADQGRPARSACARTATRRARRSAATAGSRTGRSRRRRRAAPRPARSSGQRRRTGRRRSRSAPTRQGRRRTRRGRAAEQPGVADRDGGAEAEPGRPDDHGDGRCHEGDGEVATEPAHAPDRLGQHDLGPPRRLLARGRSAPARRAGGDERQDQQRGGQVGVDEARRRRRRGCRRWPGCRRRTPRCCWRSSRR